MNSRLRTLTSAYAALSGLYKNPTRSLRGMAASDVDAEMVDKHAELLELFNEVEWGVEAEKSGLFYKILALLYEVDDYRGVTPAVESVVLREPTASADHFKMQADEDGGEVDFSDPEVRSLWKAKVLCCVAAVESRRKRSSSGALLHALDELEEFVQEKLHRPEQLPAPLPAWTTLAFVHAAQARVARQGGDYAYVRDKLLSVVECLDERAAEIINKLSDTEAKREARAALENDLVFLRQKQTLAILFSVGLDDLQRGFIDSANRACQAARFQFRLHGQACHRLFNELLMISIRRASIPTRMRGEFLKLEAELNDKILPRLRPNGGVGNPKLYVYGLRELAVVQHACGKAADMRATLRRMEKVTPLGAQWKSRIAVLHARACYGAWRQASGEIKEKKSGLLLDVLKHSDAAFKHASGGKDGVGSYEDAPSLLAFVKGSGIRNLIDTIESLVTCGTGHLFLKKYFDATGDAVKSAESVRAALKCGEAVAELSGDDNPRLRAMGHLVLADAYRESNLIVEAGRHLEIAKNLEARIQHKYVADRRRAIEKQMPTNLTLYRDTCGDIGQAEDKVLGWYINNCEDRSSIRQIANSLGIGWEKVAAYIRRQGKSSPYFHLLPKASGKKQASGTKKQPKRLVRPR